YDPSRSALKLSSCPQARRRVTLLRLPRGLGRAVPERVGLGDPMGVRLFSPRASQGEGEPAPSRFPLGREAAALLLLATAAYLALALASLAAPSARLEGQEGNWVGPVGAWLAQAFVTGFGAAAWLLPLEL